MFCGEHSQSVHDGAKESALGSLKTCLRYIAGTIDYGMDYRRSSGVELVGFTDSYWEGIASYHKRNFGCCFRLGSVVVSWSLEYIKFC